MRFRRAIAATAVAVVAGGGALLLSTSSGSAATTPPTPITLAATGLGTNFCPLPLNNKVALQPGTTALFTPPAVLGLLDRYSVSVLNEAKTTPAQKAKVYNVPNAGVQVAFPSAGTFYLEWTETVLGALPGIPPVVTLTQHAEIVISPNAQQCSVAVQVPTPSVSVPGAGPVNSIVNGVVGSVVGGVNSVAAPVNSAVGPVLGGVNGGLGGLTGGGKSGGAGAPSSSASKPGLGTTYTQSNETGAQRTVPKGGDSGGGANSGLDGQSINAAEIPFKGLGTATGTNQSVKSGGSPKTVDLAANKPSSALDGWANLIVLAAVLALSGATAFYARTYLLHPLPAKVKARS